MHSQPGVLQEGTASGCYNGDACKHAHGLHDLRQARNGCPSHSPSAFAHMLSIVCLAAWCISQDRGCILEAFTHAIQTRHDDAV